MAYVKKVIGNGGGGKKREGERKSERGSMRQLMFIYGRICCEHLCVCVRLSMRGCSCVCAHMSIYTVYDIYGCMGKTCICTLWQL